MMSRMFSPPPKRQEYSPLLEGWNFWGLMIMRAVMLLALIPLLQGYVLSALLIVAAIQVVRFYSIDD